MAVVPVQWCTAPACCQADSQWQAVRKPSVRDMATPRRKHSHYEYFYKLVAAVDLPSVLCGGSPGESRATI